MVEVPALIPHTTPVKKPALATAGVLLIHVPPNEPSVNVVHVPIQILKDPMIGVGVSLTLTTTVAIQPAADV